MATALPDLKAAAGVGSEGAVGQQRQKVFHTNGFGGAQLRGRAPCTCVREDTCVKLCV
jgi:hypothetical protein